MNETLIFFIFILFSILIFIILHLKPLTFEQIEQLSTKVRKLEIVKYFRFEKREYLPNKEFKKNMNPIGSFYQIEESLFDIPAVVSSLLKYKKHEWIIIAFEKNKKVSMIWVNKGNDNSSVSLKYEIRYFVDIAIENNYTSILIFHNHPNSKPNEYSKISPSESDIVSAKSFSNTLFGNNINLMEFVCERGNHYIYYRSICDSFCSVDEIREKICNKNNKSRMNNLSLHFKRIFKLSNNSYVINGEC